MLSAMLLRRRPWGYLLAAAGSVKFMTLGIAVSRMGLNMARVGVPVSAVQVGIFAALALAGIVMTVVLFKHISQTPKG